MMNSTYTWLLTQCLVVFNLLVKATEQISAVSVRALKAVQNSYIPDIYIFRERNSVPWVVKKGSVYRSIGCALEYSVLNTMFYPHEGEEQAATSKMDDIVMAELVDLSGVGICDMSEFFHAVRWSASAEEAPSLYEMVLVNLLADNKIISDEVLSAYVLNVITIDNPSLSVPLSSDAAKKPFLGWNCCHPVPVNPASI